MKPLPIKVIRSGTAGSVLFNTTNNLITEDNANLFYDSANARLGIGTNTGLTAKVNIVPVSSERAVVISAPNTQAANIAEITVASTNHFLQIDQKARIKIQEGVLNGTVLFGVFPQYSSEGPLINLQLPGSPIGGFVDLNFPFENQPVPDWIRLSYLSWFRGVNSGAGIYFGADGLNNDSRIYGTSDIGNSLSSYLHLQVRDSTGSYTNAFQICGGGSVNHVGINHTFGDNINVNSTLARQSTLSVKSDGRTDVINAWTFDKSCSAGITGTSSLTLYSRNSTATTNTVLSGLQLMRTTTGTPAAGLGAALESIAKCVGNVDNRQGIISFSWINATNGSQRGQVYFSASDAGGDREFIRGATNGTNALLGFYGSSPVAKPSALTAADGNTVTTGDATTDAVINNMRTRINQLESKLQSLGLLS